MDFGSVLYKAQKNEQDSRQNNKWYKTSFAPPKKEQREKKLSVNIQKFLARKEEEERGKKIEAEKKKQELLTLRNKDKKSKKRVQSMLTRTKSANKSVIEDAIDNVNTAVTVTGPLQPDEDDYGYVSKDAEELYNKLINKYSNMKPDEATFSKSSVKCSKDILNTKDRVKAALQKEEDDKLLPRKRKRKSKTEGLKDNEEDDEKSENEEIAANLDEKTDDKPEKSKKNLTSKKHIQQPPPMDFQSLLKLAATKQYEPIIVEKPVDDKPERPMTEKEKQEYLKEKERKRRREMQIADGNSRSSNIIKRKDVNVKAEQTEKKLNNERIINEKLKNNSNLSVLTSSSSNSIKNEQRDKIHSENPVQKDVNQKIKNTASFLHTKNYKIGENLKEHKNCNNDKLKTTLQPEKLLNRSSFDNPKMRQINPNMSVREKSELLMKNKEQDYREEKKRVVSNNDTMKKIAKQNNSDREVNESRQQNSFSSQFTRQFLPRGVVRKVQKPKMRRQVIESDDEYDSEMDDFIDDTEDNNDVSKYISEIFGYDRNKYRRIDDDDADQCMESNFSQLQKEEFLSTKYGILEDLEDIKRTKLEKERKKKGVMSMKS